MMAFLAMHTIMILPTILVTFASFWLRVGVRSKTKSGHQFPDGTFSLSPLLFKADTVVQSYQQGLYFL